MLLPRRSLLSSGLSAAAVSAFAGKPLSAAPALPSGSGREYYELRTIYLQSGPQQKLTDTYVAEALIPALGRLGVGPVGAFSLDIGPETPVLYLLLPSLSLEALVNTDAQLATDEEFQKAAAPFWGAPAKEPAFVRIESALLHAFTGYPKLTVTPATAQKGKRVFQLRTYESPSHADHVRKIEMFHSGEFDIFAKAGFWSVFYGDTLIGARMPNLTYMLSFPDASELNDKWKAFTSDPDWKKLTANPRFNSEALVTNITNLVLRPASYSQI